jgi:hypothetical protein
MRSLPVLVCIFLFVSQPTYSIIGNKSRENDLIITELQDTSFLNQLLYNGSVWKGLYYNIYGTQFMFDDDWMKGSVSLGGVQFDSLELKYDIYSDDIIVNYNDIRLVVLNRELLDSFILKYGDENMHFRNFRDSDNIKGYYQVLHEGDSKLYKKWHKKRAQFVIEARYDEFQYENQLILVTRGKVHRISRRGELIKIMGDRKKEIRNFMRLEQIKIDIDSPATIIPLLEYYDSIKED